MPRKYWLPLLLQEQPLQHHLHAAITAWFDGEQLPHNAQRKPYTISPPTFIDGDPGVVIATLDEWCDEVMWHVAQERPSLQLGRQSEVLVGAPQVMAEASWQDLAERKAPRSKGWRVSFLTPTQFRKGKAPQLLPSPALVLNAAADALAEHAPEAVPPADRGLFHQVTISELELSTTSLLFGNTSYPGFLGEVVYQCVERDVADALAPLFATMEFTGVGSYRARGLGQVSVQACEPPMRHRKLQLKTRGGGEHAT